MLFGIALFLSGAKAWVVNVLKVSAKVPKLAAMSNIYESLAKLVREHWKNHSNAYPQRIELSAADWQALNADRKLVNETMNFDLLPDWEHSFLGVPVKQADVSNLFDVNGQAIPVMVMEAVDAEKKE